MKPQSLALLFAAVFVLSACGGAATDTPPTTPPTQTDPIPSSTSSSSVTTSSSSKTSSAVATSSSSAVVTSSSSSSSKSSSSSSAASLGCSKIEGNIFIDCTDPAWKGLQAFEQTKDYKTQGAVTDGTQGQIATWHTLMSADQDHNNVIEVQFKDNDNYNALVHFVANTPSETRDMSAYATGKLMFDIKLINAGKLSPQLNVMLECVYPCISHDHHITIPAANQWTSVEVPIAEFIEGGMDLTKTSLGFEIVPEWNKQNGVQFQLDNIRWVKGAGVAPKPEAHCYEQRFETWNLPYQFDTLVGSSSLTSGALTKIISTSEMTPNWSTATDKFGYAPKTDNSFTPCAFTDGNLSAQVYLPKSYVDDGKMRVGLYYQDSSNRRAYFAPVSAANLAADAWKTISSPLVTTNNAPAFSATDALFNINDINYVGVYFDANGKPANVGGMLRVDNVFISGKSVTPNVPSSNTNLCDAGTQAFSGATPTGFGVVASQHFYVRAALTNATFVGLNLSLSSPNIQFNLAQGGNGSTSAIFDVTAINAITASEQLQAAFNYQATDANQTTSVTFTVHSTKTEAVNSSNALSTNSVKLLSGVNCSSSSSISSATISSSSKSSSSSSAQMPSSSSSSSSSLVASSSSSKASCSIAAKVDSSSPTLGFGLTSGTHGFLVIKLSNADFVSPATQVSLTNATVVLASSSSAKVIFDITATDNLPSSTTLDVSFGFQQLNAASAVTREISLYTSASNAINEVGPLSSSTTQIIGPANCN